jgi:hypothetical protein
VAADAGVLEGTDNTNIAPRAESCGKYQLLKVTSMLGEIEGSEQAGLNLRDSCLTAFNWKGGKPGGNPPRLVRFPEEKLGEASSYAFASSQHALVDTGQAYRRPSFLGVPAQGTGAIIRPIDCPH